MRLVIDAAGAARSRRIPAPRPFSSHALGRIARRRGKGDAGTLGRTVREVRVPVRLTQEARERKDVDNLA